MRGLPPGPNVGTQLRAIRARRARQAKQAQEAQQAQSIANQKDRAQTALAQPSAKNWFAARGWTPFPFQREVWKAVAQGRSGMLHATTGSGKTYAVALGLLDRVLRQAEQGKSGGSGVQLLWITPMRALSADTARALTAPLAELGLAWTVGVRTGDTDSATRSKQRQQLPEILVTTPESLSLLFTRADSPALFANLQMVVVDEWHELIGNKRGVQVQLALARLQSFARQRVAPSSSAALNTKATNAAPPLHEATADANSAHNARAKAFSNPLVIWGLSATLGNLQEAMHALLGHLQGVLVQGRIEKNIVVDTLLPDDPGRFPWGGHLGIQMLAPVLREVDAGSTTLIFTNTRSQSEIWYRSLLDARPDWAGLIALHHGSLDKETRDWVELGLKEGRLKAVVATSSLDLGVDFLPVERVLQIGSPKGVARLLQRAGRSGHAPGRVSRVTIVPTNALELVESAAAQKAAAARRVEARTPPAKPLDVLVQHLVTIALGTGFLEGELLAEVRQTASYAQLSDAEWRWAVDFASRGGESLSAYPDYHRIAPDEHGVFHVPNAQIARRHRMSVGTIVADSAMLVRYASGGNIGTIEESFIARLRQGDVFTFGGKRLELLRVRDMTAIVQQARTKSAAVPRWNGTKMPLSTELSEAVLAELEAALAGRFDSPEMQRARPLIELQARWSSVPTRQTLVLEGLRSREGRHLFAYPFAGRQVHLGLASLLAWRIGQRQPATFSMSVNDYGFELLSATDLDWQALWQPAQGLLNEERLLEDILASLNAGELSKRRFREIARVSGLIFQGFPGAPKSVRQLQASSQLIYDVFRKYDANNLLLSQADREVLEQELDLTRLRSALARMRQQQQVLHELVRPTPFGFPLMIERLREQLTTEKLADRIERMVAELERQADVASSA